MYLGIALIAFATLALEVSLTRLLSVVTWYHLAFFAVSTAMLGMTAGATTVYLQPGWFDPEPLRRNVAWAGLGFALATPVTLVMLCLIPLGSAPSAIGAVAMLLATGFCCLPFYFSGIVVTAVLTRVTRPVGWLYASDLGGAALGCLFVLGALEVVDTPSLILVCGAMGALAALAFTRGEESSRRRRACGWVLGLLLVTAGGNALTRAGVQPLVVKGRVEDATSYLVDRWNSFSRVVVYEGELSRPQLWGPSPLAPRGRLVFQHRMTIDGEAGTFVRRGASAADLEHLRYDVTNVGYFLRPSGGACVIGVGGGRDLQSAVLFGQERVVGVEVNPIFVDLLEHDFRDLTGLADRPGVRLVAEEARSYLSRSTESFAIIQMSLTDTWAATSAGAFSLSENGLYTVEAWQTFLDRLQPDGILAVSRWYSPGLLGETGRLTSLAVASLLRQGADEPAAHLAMLASGSVSTMLVARQPFSAGDLGALQQVADSLDYALVLAPGRAPSSPALRGIVSARSPAELERALVDLPLVCRPPTDDSPYFFNMLRLDRLGSALQAPPGVLRGNLTATLTLLGLILSLAIFCALTIVLPLALRSLRAASGDMPRSVLWPGVAYFCLIGAGFMLLEIALVQRFTVFLGNPVYALGVLLFTLIASAGGGSALSEYLPVTARPVAFSLPIVTAAAAVTTRWLLPAVLASLTAVSVTVRCAAAVAVIVPLGVLMGLFFPTGMRLVRAAAGGDTPWFWALNGVFGVLGSAVAVLIAIAMGISANFLVAAGCYLLLVPCVAGILARAHPAEIGDDGDD